MNPEYRGRLDLRDNPVCMEAFETSDKPRYFHDELECRGYLKQETNCKKNSVFLQAMGIKCPQARKGKYPGDNEPMLKSQNKEYYCCNDYYNCGYTY